MAGLWQTYWKAGVCLATLGPGATNFTTPAAYGFWGFPLVMITGQKPIKSQTGPVSNSGCCSIIRANVK